MRKRQNKRSKCIKACESNRLGDTRCNCSAQGLLLGHFQPGDVVAATYECCSGNSITVQVVVTGDLSGADAKNGCIPERGRTMCRLLHSEGPNLILPARSPAKAIRKYVPRVVDGGNASTDPLGGN